jgi:hypothetical protein
MAVQRIGVLDEDRHFCGTSAIGLYDAAAATSVSMITKHTLSSAKNATL